jgi:nucleolin
MLVQLSRPRERKQFTNDLPPRNPVSKTLFVGNMSFEMTDSDLNNLFRDVKNVTDVRVAVDRRTGQPRGFAHADFIDIASAQQALAYLSGKEVLGRRLRLDYSTQSSRRPGDERKPREEE